MLSQLPVSLIFFFTESCIVVVVVVVEVALSQNYTKDSQNDLAKRNEMSSSWYINKMMMATAKKTKIVMTICMESCDM